MNEDRVMRLARQVVAGSAAMDVDKTIRKWVFPDTTWIVNDGMLTSDLLKIFQSADDKKKKEIIKVIGDRTFQAATFTGNRRGESSRTLERALNEVLEMLRNMRSN